MRRWGNSLGGRAPLGYRVAVKTYQLALALPFSLAFGVAGHAVLSRGVKAVLWAWAPLASGEPEAARYEREVLPTADLPMMQIVAGAAAAGLVFWLALATGSSLIWLASFAAMAGVIVVDVLRWERVAVSGHNLWFQRGFRGKVHQVVLDNIRDASIDESEARGFTLRHGTHNRMVRLQVRMNDKRLIALPKTDGHSGRESVESVANFLEMRLQQIRDRDPARKPRLADLPPRPAAVSEAVAAQDEDLRRALARLRKHAAGRPPVASGSSH
jgi:hypothetical protein